MLNSQSIIQDNGKTHAGIAGGKEVKGKAHAAEKASQLPAQNGAGKAFAAEKGCSLPRQENCANAAANCAGRGWQGKGVGRRGMAISVDALLAIAIFIAMIAFVSVSPISDAPTTQQQNTSVQMIDDAMVAMDSTGFLMEKIDNKASQTPQQIEDDISAKLENLLPSNIGFKLQMRQYASSVDNPIGTCRSDQDYDACFPDTYDFDNDPLTPEEANPREIFSTDEPVPANKEIIHGKKVFIKKEPGDCYIPQFFEKKSKEFSLLFQGNHSPEAIDVNVTVGAACPAVRNPCPETDDTMRCCYVYYDEDLDSQDGVEYKWYRFNEKMLDWELTGNTNQTFDLNEGVDTNRFKCSVKVKDDSGEPDTEWSQDTNSPFAIVGGPCFFFSAGVSQDQLECGETTTVTFDITAESGERSKPVDIMLSMDRSGSMSWIDISQLSGTETSVFVETGAIKDTAYVGTIGGSTDYVYKMDVNKQSGDISSPTRQTAADAINDAYDIFVDSSYVYVADGSIGLTILNKSDLSKIRTIGAPGAPKELTNVTAVTVQGNYIYVAAAGTTSTLPTKSYGVRMDDDRTGNYDALMEDIANNPTSEYIGYNSTYSWAAQSFVPTVAVIKGVDVSLRKYCSPSNCSPGPGPLTLRLRSIITGADIAAVTVSASSILTGNDYWYSFEFSTPVTLVPGQTYYIALTTTTTSQDNYYIWATRRRNNSDPYPNGGVYWCIFGGSCTASSSGSTYYDAGFRVYQEGEFIGYSAAESWGAQSFRATVNKVDGVELELKKVGNPGDLTVHLRDAITGADLTNGTATIPANTINTYFDWNGIGFPNTGVALTINQTYYIVATTTMQDSANYYIWGVRDMPSDPYGNGYYSRCTAGLACASQDLSRYEDARFRTYRSYFLVGGLVIIDKSSADPDNWTILSNLYDTVRGTIDQPQDVVVSGNYAYMAEKTSADSTQGLWVIDVSNPNVPVMTGYRSTPNAYGVDLSGNYAYIADRTGGFYVINVLVKSDPTIAKNINTLGTVKDVFVKDTNAYVIADNTGSGATNIGLHVIKVTDPPNATKLETFYTPYSNFYRIFVGDEFCFATQSSYGLTTIDRFFGTKMNISRNSAREFVSYEEWHSPLDRLGVVSFASDVALNSALINATDLNKALVRTAIDGIMANGSTAVADGIALSLQQLTGPTKREDALKFIILLSDGQANVCLGGYSCSSSAAIQDAKNQALIAAANQVYIFTIGFGGDADAATMQWIADNAYCPDKAGGDCGSYHHISDQNALSTVYALIAQNIAALAGRLPDKDTTDTSISFTGFSGIQLSNLSGGCVLQGGTTVVCEDIDIRFGWTGSFDATVPCDYDGCEDDFSQGKKVVFPGDYAEVYFEIGGVPQPVVEWPEKFIVERELYYRDIVPEFLGGKFFGIDDIELYYVVSNIGYVDVDLTQSVPTVSFLENSSASTACEGTDTGTWKNFSDLLDAAYGINHDGIPTPSTSTEDTTANLSTSGWICLWLNKGPQQINECTYNNRIVVNCAVPETFVYMLDYWAWEK